MLFMLAVHPHNFWYIWEIGKFLRQNNFQISLQPQNFNYVKMHYSISDNLTAILKNLFVKETHSQKFCTLYIKNFRIYDT